MAGTNSQEGSTSTPTEGYTAAYFDTQNRVARALGPRILGGDWQIDYEELTPRDKDYE